MSREELVLRQEGVRLHEGGLKLELRIPWYRSLPLSSIVDVLVVVDGTRVDRDMLRFRLDGVAYRFADFEPRWDVVWFIQDPLIVTTPDLGLVPGQEVEVTGGLGLRIPYIIIEPIGPLERSNQMTRRIRVV